MAEWTNLEITPFIGQLGHYALWGHYTASNYRKIHVYSEASITDHYWPRIVFLRFFLAPPLLFSVLRLPEALISVKTVFHVNKVI